MIAPWQQADALPPAVMGPIRRRAIFEWSKWDTQVEDVTTIADIPLILTEAAWRELARLAEALARESMLAEDELADRPDLHARLALPRRLAKALGTTRSEGARGLARLVRFDFHHTPDGWRISEANTDVPGGLNEASGLASLIGPHYAGTTTAGDVCGAYARAFTTALHLHAGDEAQHAEVVAGATATFASLLDWLES